MGQKVRAVAHGSARAKGSPVWLEWVGEAHRENDDAESEKEDQASGPD